MNRPDVQRVVAAIGAVALVPIGLVTLGAGTASAAPGSVTWNDGNEEITRTISDVNPAAGDVITVTNTFDRTGGAVEYITAVKDLRPACWTYVEGSAKTDGVTQSIESRGTQSAGLDFVRVTGSWPLWPHVEPNIRTYSFQYTVGANCARGVALSTSTVHYSGSLGSGTYWDKGPAVTVKTDTTTELAAASGAKVGQVSQLTATVTGGAAGNVVEFYDGATKVGEGPLVGNAVTIGWTPATAGQRSLTAKFVATTAAASSTSAVQSVQVAVADVETSTALEVPATATTGQAVELKATVAPAPSGGTVQFKDGNVNLGGPVNVTNGVATLSHAFDAAGGKSITAVFSGVAGFTGSTSAAGSIAVSDPDVSTSTTVEVPATATTGQAVELKATVSPAPSGGTVQFKADGADVGGPVNVTNGVATLSHAFDAAGGKSITAVFSGVAGFTGSTSQAGLIAVSDPAPVDVATSVVAGAPATAKVGVVVDLSATLTPSNAAGTVQFKDGGVNIGGAVPVVDGVATFQHTFTSAGSKNVTAVFTGGTGFLGSTSQAVSVEVSDPLPTDVATTTTLEVPATATVGQTLTFTASVAPGTAAGTVQFKDGDRAIGLPVTIVDGKATLSYSFSSAGAKNVTAVYSGGPGFQASTSAQGVVTVTAAPTTGGGGSLDNLFGS